MRRIVLQKSPRRQTSMARFVDLEFVTSCPVCDYPISVLNRPILGVRTRRVLGPAIPPDVMRCANCRTYFRNPRPSGAEILASYNRGLMYAQWQQQRRVREQIWQIRVRLVTKYRTGGVLLDIGTGDGEFLSVAKAAGFEVIGTEPSTTGTRLASARGHDVRIGRLQEIDFKDRRFDVVTVWHDLEHVSRPNNLLRRIHELLKPDGLLFVAVPNEEWILFRRGFEWRRVPRGMPRLVPGEEIHLTHFQPRTLKRALKGAGFALIAFGVDDVDLERTAKERLKQTANCLLSTLMGWHLGPAMYVISRKTEGSPREL